MTDDMYYIATDDDRFLIYGLGHTPAEAVADAREQVSDPEAEFVVLAASEALYRRVERDGGGPDICWTCDDGEARLVRDTIEAWLDDIDPWVDPAHGTDPERVAAIVAHVLAAGRWDLPPVLAVELLDESVGYGLLDGHHRCAAARHLEQCGYLDVTGVGYTRIPAYIVGEGDFRELLDTHFDGEEPARLDELDEYILVDGGPYRGRA